MTIKYLFNVSIKCISIWNHLEFSILKCVDNVREISKVFTLATASVITCDFCIVITVGLDKVDEKVIESTAVKLHCSHAAVKYDFIVLVWGVRLVSFYEYTTELCLIVVIRSSWIVVPSCSSYLSIVWGIELVCENVIIVSCVGRMHKSILSQLI